MKNIFISCLICLSAFTQAQFKSFDVLQESSTTHSKGRHSESNLHLWLVNSKTGDKVRLQKNKNIYIASFFDPAAGLLHYFNIYNKDNSLLTAYSNSYRHQVNGPTELGDMNMILPPTAIMQTAPLEYEVKVFNKKTDKKPEYIFQIKLEKAQYTNLETNVDNRAVQYAVKKSLITKLADLPCCYRIVSYKSIRTKGAYATEYIISKEKGVNIIFTVPEVLRIDSL